MKKLTGYISLLLVICLIYSCHRQGHSGSGGHLTIKWSHKVDSLLHDTAKAGTYIDSMKTLVLNAESDTSAINHLNALAKEYSEGSLLLANEAIIQSQKYNYPYGIAEGEFEKGLAFSWADKNDSALIYADKSLTLFQKSGNARMISLNLGLKSLAYVGKNDFDKALDFDKQALKIAQDSGIKDQTAYILLDIASVYGDQANFQEVIHYDTLALPLLKALPNMKLYANCLTTLGRAFGIHADYTKAMEYFKLSLKIDEDIKSDKGIASNTGQIGNIYYLEANYPKALEYYNQSLQIGKKINNKSRIALSLSNLGLVYRAENDTGNALANYRQALQIGKEMNDKRRIADCLNMMGQLYNTPTTKAKSLDYLHQSLQLAIETHDNYQTASNYANIADIYYSQKEYDSSLIYVNKAVELAKKIEDNIRIADSYGLKAQIFLKKGNVEIAKKFADSSLQVAKKGGTPEDISSSTHIHSTIDEQMGDYKGALELYKEYADLKDTLNNTAQVKKFASVEYKAKEEQLKAEQEKQDAVFVAEAAKKEAELKRQKTIRWAFTGGFLLVLLLALTVYRNLQQNKKKTQIISEQKEEMERQKLIVETKNKEIVDSITYAKRLQDAILPPLNEIHKALPESFVLYKPKDIVAGDFYWIASGIHSKGGGEASSSGFPLRGSDGAVLIAAADCTGHGVPGALVSVVCSNALNRAVKEFGLSEPGVILDKVRELVLETFSHRDPFGEKSESDVKDGMDISLASLSPSERGTKVQWAGANNPLWYMHKGEMKELRPDKQPIGKHYNEKPFSTQTINLEKGDTLYLFTDGYADQFGGDKGKKFKYKQLQNTLVDMASTSIEKQREKLDEIFESWQGMLEQVDDVLVIGIRI